MFPDFVLAPSFVLLFSISILGLTWYYKKRISVYNKFPSVNFLIPTLKFILRINIPQDIPVTSFIFQYFIDVCKQFQSEGLFLLWIFQPYLIIFNEEAFKVIGNDHNSIGKPFNFGILKEFWGKSLLTSSGDLWRKRRKMFNPLFYKSMMRDNVPMINKNAAILVKQLMELPQEKPVVILKYLKLCAFMNIYEYLSGMEHNKPENHAEVQYFIDSVTVSTAMSTYRMCKPWLHPRFTMITFDKGRKFLKRVKEGHQLLIEYLKKMKISPSYLEKSHKEKETDENYKMARSSFPEMMKEYHLKDPSFTFLDIKDEFSGLMTAGFDTVSYALMWNLFLLGHHPEVQDRLFEEVDSFMVSRNALYAEDLEGMKYIDCVIKETLRLYPPVPIFARYVSRDVKCGKYTIPKDTNIIFYLYASGRDPKLYPNPEKFDPDRFLEMNPDRASLMLTFAEGARNCIGKHFALMELKIVLAHIIKHFKVTSLDNPEDVNLSWEIVLNTVEPLRFRLNLRDHVSGH